MILSVLGLLVRVLLVLLVLRLLGRFVASVVRGYRGVDGRPRVTELVKDPLTGTYLPRDSRRG